MFCFAEETLNTTILLYERRNVQVTQNQLYYGQLQETIRHNQAYELEMNRSNLASESIKRSGQAIDMMGLGETTRHNQATEANSLYNTNVNAALGMFTSLQSRAASKYAADRGYASSIYSSDQHLAATQYSADKSSAASRYATDAGVRNTGARIAADKWIASQNNATSIANAKLQANTAITTTSIAHAWDGFNAGSLRQNALANTSNATTNARNASTNEKNASTNRMNASTNQRNAGTNAKNASTNRATAGANVFLKAADTITNPFNKKGGFLSW